MKLKELHTLLQDVAPFKKAKIDLEQYPTNAHLASQMLFMIDSNYGELEGQYVVDLGCGTGMLSIGAALLGASHVVGLDIDGDALETAVENVAEFGDEDGEGLPIDFIRSDIPGMLGQRDEGPSPSPLLSRLRADVVLMNPPFGTKKNKGVDMEFLRAAFQVSRGAVYSLHKTSTRAHIQRLAERELRASSAKVIAELRFDLPSTMKFHTHKSVDIEVDLWRFVVPQAGSGGDE